MPWEAQGSSPLTRGKREGLCACHVILRLIPAHAGKTWFSGPRGMGFRAHPRSRGENQVTARRTHCATGSSPLTRGKRERDTPDRVARGLIPAHAGKTTTRHSMNCLRWAHPRSRGENERGAAPLAGKSGSSPLTRGKLAGSRRNLRRPGLIPAHAGKTSLHHTP